TASNSTPIKRFSLHTGYPPIDRQQSVRQLELLGKGADAPLPNLCPSSKCERIYLDARIQEFDGEGVIDDLSVLLPDQLIKPLTVPLPASSASMPCIAAGAWLSKVTLKRTGLPPIAGPSTRCRSRAWKRKVSLAPDASATDFSSPIVQRPVRPHWLRLKG